MSYRFCVSFACIGRQDIVDTQQLSYFLYKGKNTVVLSANSIIIIAHRGYWLHW